MKNRSAVLSIITVISAFYLYELIDSGIIGTFALYKFDYFSHTHEYYRLFTVALVHDNSSTIPFHLGLNMLNLYLIGSPVERILGRARFLIVFFGSLLTASLASSLFLPWEGYSIGASGAVYGVIGAFAMLGRRTGSDIRSMIGFLAITELIGFTNPGIDWHAHVAGFIGGAIITKLLLTSSRY